MFITRCADYVTRALPLLTLSCILLSFLLSPTPHQQSPSLLPPSRVATSVLSTPRTTPPPTPLSLALAPVGVLSTPMALFLPKPLSDRPQRPSNPTIPRAVAPVRQLAVPLIVAPWSWRQLPAKSEANCRERKVALTAANATHANCVHMPLPVTEALHVWGVVPLCVCMS